MKTENEMHIKDFPVSGLYGCQTSTLTFAD
jgi:hypothetical protein